MTPYGKQNSYKEVLRKCPEEEVVRLVTAFNRVVPYFIKNEIGVRIRRGILQKSIFKTLGLRISSLNRCILNSVLEAHGVEKILIDGRAYYAGPPKKRANPRKSVKRQLQSLSQNPS